MTDLAKGANTAVAASAVRVVVAWRSGPDLDAAALLLTATGKVLKLARQQGLLPS